MANRLANATSPYLLQHAENLVDWWEWGPEAFAEAKRRDTPILLSVGYSACHWCHVMAHESFEDADTARLINEVCVPIKVDREERPDVDAVYMQATQAMTGQGGWPMTCLLAPDRTPFFCGTYFPRAQLQSLLAGVRDAWSDRRDAVLAQGAQLVDALGGAMSLPAGPALSAEDLDTAAAELLRGLDPAHGGFGGAPKFPPSMCVEFLLRHHARTGDAAAMSAVEQTCAAMARGGMYDQLAGGFARYSVDAAWVVPHFEKMLYDNALLLRVYTHLWRATGSPLARRVAGETADFLRRDLSTPERGFASALDADTDGVEGMTYVWTPAQLAEVLGDPDGAWAAQLFDVTAGGTFEHGASTLQLARDPDDPARWADVRETLAAARAGRPQPGRDDKVVAAWNGLAIAALAESAMLLDRPEDLDAAIAAADLLERVHRVDGRLRRTSRDGVVGPHAGVLEDYADVAGGYLALHQATADPRWLRAAGELLDTVQEHFPDGEGGFYDTADDVEALLRRPQDPTDGATPGGYASAVGALATYAALAGMPAYRESAEAALARLAPLVRGHPRFTGEAAAVGEALLAGPLEVAVVGASIGGVSGRAGADLVTVARRGTAPGTVVVAGHPDAPGVPLLANRPLIGGVPTAYVCRGFVCDAPVTDLGQLRDRVTPAL